MCTEKIVRRVAGSMILLSLALGFFVSPYFYYLTAFVGLNLLQSSFTGFCPLEKILDRFNVPSCEPAQGGGTK